MKKNMMIIVTLVIMILGVVIYGVTEKEETGFNSFVISADEIVCEGQNSEDYENEIVFWTDVIECIGELDNEVFGSENYFA